MRFCDIGVPAPGRASALRAARTLVIASLTLLVVGAPVWSGSALAAIQNVQSNYYSPHSDQSAVSVTYGYPQLAGSLNVVIVAFNNSTSNVQSVTDTQGNTYTLAVGPTVLADFGKLYIYYANNIVAADAGQNTVTVVLDAVTPYPDVRIAEYSGIDPWNPFDVAVGSTGLDTGLSMNSGSLTTTNADSLLVAGNFVEFHSMEAGENYTMRLVSYDGHILEDRIVSAIGTYEATATVNYPGRWIMQLAAFKGASSGGDTQAPTTPTNLSATAVSSSQVTLGWTASTDDVGVTSYLVERCQGNGCSNFGQIATPPANSYSDTGLSPSTSYSYRVRAQDAAPNFSPYSIPASAIIPAAPSGQSSLQIESARYRIEQVVPVPGAALTYDVTARAAISNAGTAASGATARIVGVDPAATVFDGNVGFGDVPPIAPLDAIRSIDTLKLRIVITAPDDLQHAIQSAQALIEGLYWQISCAECAGVRAPIANAGPDQTVAENQTVTLDGSASTDPDGHALQFSWSVLSTPAGAQVQLATAASVRPTIVLPVPGTYVVKLVVSDGSVSSAPSTVTLSTGNSPPVAHAGFDQTAPVGTTVKLSGGASTDVNGDWITYEWELIETPAASQTALANADPAMSVADFVPDTAGRYVAQLVVHDAVSSSAPDTTIISTSNSAPVANAGTDVRGQVGQAVVLSGNASSDPDGNAVNYRWSLVAAPAGSTAALGSTNEISTTLTPDVPGTYVAQLVVDDDIAQSEPDTVVVSTANSRPVAILSDAYTVTLNHIVTVNASSSFDPDGDAISFSWSILSTPVGSTTGLESNGQQTTQFIADVAGTYVLQVSVSDGALDAPPDTAQITIDFDPPPPAVLSLVTVTLDPHGGLIVRGAAGSVQPNSFVRIRNVTSEDWRTVVADANGAFESSIVGQIGDELLVRVQDQAGIAQAEQQLDNTGQTLQVVIDRRWESETVSGRHFVINGRLIGPLDAGVSVNGTAATVVGTGAVREFYVSVPVTAGANTVTAVAQRVAGAQATDSIVVAAAETPTFSVQAAPENGLAPLDVEFTIQRYVRDRISRIEIDFDGDFVTDLTELTRKTRFQHRYEQPGVYWARFLITTQPTQTYEIRIPVAVFATADVDSQIQTVWQLFTGALAAGDRATALQYMTTSAAQKYESVFTQLQMQMPAIIASFSVAEPVDVLTGTAEYIVRRQIDGTEQAFFIYFVRAADGTWRIGSM